MSQDTRKKPKSEWPAEFKQTAGVSVSSSERSERNPTEAVLDQLLQSSHSETTRVKECDKKMYTARAVAHATMPTVGTLRQEDPIWGQPSLRHCLKEKREKKRRET